MSYVDTLHDALDWHAWQALASYYDNDPMPGYGWVTINCLVFKRL